MATDSAGTGPPDDPKSEFPLGATIGSDGRVRFRVWAPRASSVQLVLNSRRSAPIALTPEGRGYFSTVMDTPAGERYRYRIGSRRLPDPASRSQPEGLAGPSEVFDASVFPWADRRWRPPELDRSVLYELHVGTFTDEGTLDRAIPELADLVRVGVTSVELLPVEEERAEVGWGYGPVFSFAVRRSYGGPRALQRFVDAAHGIGLSVVLDVVFNHWSREAAFLERFGPYFHPRATTPWGPTPNLEGPESDEVRRHFFECARSWVRDFHVDGFRLDAVHEVRDRNGPPFWGELGEVVRAEGQRSGKDIVLIAESDLNDVRILRPVADGGWGLDAQWSDDFHHALHAALTGERRGYYADFGPLTILARTFEVPIWFQGQYSKYNRRRRGAPAAGIGPQRFVVFDQNHDQVGNRGDGARLTTLLPGDLARVALALVLFSPSIPMLFMGEEYGETRPFYFFTDTSLATGPILRRGRNRDLRALGFDRLPPSPTARTTFAASKLDRGTVPVARADAYRRLVREFTQLRRDRPALAPSGRVQAIAWESERLIAVQRESGGDALALVANVGPTPARVPSVDWPGEWRELLRSDRPEDRPRSAVEWRPAAPDTLDVAGRSFRVFARRGTDGPTRA